MSGARVYALDPDKRITQLVHTAWTSRDGAPSGALCIVQGHGGYLWLSNMKDAYRFDGIRFERWNPPAEWASRLGDQPRGCPLVTRDGALWMSVGDGLARIRDRDFTWFPLGIDRFKVYSLVEEDETNLLVIAHGEGLYRVDRRTGSAQRLGRAHGILRGVPSRLWIDRDRTVWLVVREVWEGATTPSAGSAIAAENTVLFKPKGDRTFHATGVKLGDVFAFAQAADGTIWMAETTRSVRVFRSAHGQYLPPGPEIAVGAAGLVIDRHGSLWIPSLGDGLRRIAYPASLGAHRIATRGKQAEIFTEEQGLSSDVVYAAFEDSEGNVWFAGANGVDRFRGVRLTELTAKEGLVINFDVRSSLVPQAHGRGVTVLTGTAHGVLEQVTDEGKVTTELPYIEAGNRSVKECVGAPGSSRNVLRVLSRESNGTIWAAGQRLFVRGPEGWRCIPLESNSGSPEVTAMSASSGGGVWLGTSHNELWRYPRSGPLTRVAVSRVAQPVTAVLEQQNGTVWFGGVGGLVGVRGHDVVEIGNAQGLPRGGVYTLFTGINDEVWILGPKGVGVLRDGRVIMPAALEHVPLAGCWSSVRDGSDLWFNCQHGLVRISARELFESVLNPGRVPRYEQFDALDDLRSEPIQTMTPGSITRSMDGRIWFVTQKGLGYIDPQRLERSVHPPPVYIHAARAGDTAFDVRSSATLPPISGALQISFTAISLAHPERLVFRYRLEGADDDWRETRDRSVSYSTLSAGDYRLHVIAADYLGVSSEHEAVWTFSIAPRWNETWWFRLSFCAAMAGMLLLAGRIAFARQASNLKREFSVQLAERTRIAGELHDTLLQGFQGTTMQLHAVATKLPPGSPERRRLDAVLMEVQDVLDDGRKAIWAIRESTTTGPDLKAAFARVATHVNVCSSASIEVTDEGEPRPMNPIRRDVLYQLGRQALMNAFQHSHAETIQVHLVWQSRCFRLIVRDNGVGIPDDIGRDGREGHFGLAGMRERAERIGAQLELHSTLGRGTEIAVNVPAASIYLHPMSPWYRTFIARLTSLRSHRV